MTYFPPPHQPPQGPLGFDPDPRPGNPIHAARRAGILMFVMAGLTLLCGAHGFVESQHVDWDEQMKQSEVIYGPELSAQMKAQGPSAQTMKAVMQVSSGLIIAIGFALLILALFVRRASFGAIITSAILTAPIILFSLCPTVLAGLLLLKAGPQALLQVIQALLPLPISIALFIYLIKAARITIKANRIQAQTQLQFWQSQQQLARPGNGGPGYGYGAAGGNMPPQQGPRMQYPLGPVPPPPDETSK